MQMGFMARKFCSTGNNEHTFLFLYFGWIFFSKKLGKHARLLGSSEYLILIYLFNARISLVFICRIYNVDYNYFLESKGGRNSNRK